MTECIEVGLLHDHHSHVSLYAALASCPTITGLRQNDALDFLAALPVDQLTVVTGWKTSELALTKGQLDDLPPLLLINASLHGYAISSAGLPLVASSAPDLAWQRDNPIWLEANVPRIFAAYCELAGLTEAKLAGFMQGLESMGSGSAEDMVLSSEAALQVMRASTMHDRLRYWASPNLFASLDAVARKACTGIKLFLDGAIGARSAGIRGPWRGDGAAVFIHDDDGLADLIQQVADWQTGLAIHAIGELAINQALIAITRVQANGGQLPLVRLEHAQFIQYDQARHARDMGLILSMQPNFSSDSVDYADRLPVDYLGANNPFRMLIDELGFVPGQDLVFGSDGMPHGLAYAVHCALFPPFPGQRLTLPELVNGYGPALGSSNDHKSIQLEVDYDNKLVTVR
jgi:predicted amidohydrolase YtcJ